jgi:hypothetical protein
MSMRLAALVGAAFCWAARAADNSGYSGAAACALCHTAQARRQSLSGHALALRRAADHPLATSFFRDRKKIRPPGFRFEFRDGPALRLSDSSAAVDVPVEWAFGAGSQAVTFVSRVDSSYYVELFFSYYRALNGLAPTPGQQDLEPAGLAEAAGLYYKTRDPEKGIDGCFRCHSTGPLRFNAGQAIQPWEAGVHCEVCHGPGEPHIAAARRGEERARRLVDNPARWTAARQMEFCGTCHRKPAPAGEDIDWSFAWNVRHEPAYLVRSACFRRSNGALSCLTCHQPHEPLEQAVSSYNQQCLRCHAGQPAVCKTNCIDCHMPRVSPQPPLRFTNHWIGVYRSADKLRPLAR